MQHPRAVLAIAAFSVLALSPGLLRLELRTDGHALVPRGAPEIVYDAEVRRTFGTKDWVAVTITAEASTDIFNIDTLRLVATATEAISAIASVDAADVVSLATTKRDRVDSRTFKALSFLEPLPSTDQQAGGVRDDVKAMRILDGTIVSYDHRTTAILIGVDAEGDRAGLYRDILQVVQGLDASAHTIRVVGAPVAESLLGLHIIDDLTVLIPLVVTAMSLLLYWLTRSAWAVAIVMSEVGATLLSTFGIMGYAGVPVYLTMAVLPVTLTVIAIADDIHIFSRYRYVLARSALPPCAPTGVAATMEDMSRPVVVTSMTTAIAFLSFTASPIAPIQAFGVFQCIGVLFAMLWSLTVTPAALVLIDPSRFGSASRAAAGGSVRWLDGLAIRVLARPGAYVAGIVVLVAVCALGIGRVQVQDSWIDGFSPTSRFFRDTTFVNQSFHGTHLLLVVVETNPADYGILKPATLTRVGELETFITGLPTVGGVLGPQSYLATMSYLLHGRDEQRRRTPSSLAYAEAAYDFLEQVRGTARRREIIDDSRTRGVITVFMKNANFIDTATAMNAILDYERRVLKPHGVRLRFAGDVAVSQAMIPAIVRSQVGSLLLSLVGIALIAMILCRSVAQGVSCVMPAILAVAIVFGVMGALGVPLGVATSMFCAITLGIGVDYGVHLVHRVRSLAAGGKPADRVLTEAMTTSGTAITIDAITIAVGFGILMFSQVPADGRLGLLVAASITACYLLTMVGLPAALAIWRPSFLAQSERLES